SRLIFSRSTFPIPTGYHPQVKKTKEAPNEPNPNARRMVIHNRKARHEYAIDETYDAGLSLVGAEVKSIRAGQAHLQDAFCKIENGEVWLHNMHINPFEHGTHWNVEPRRARKP